MRTLLILCLLSLVAGCSWVEPNESPRGTARGSSERAWLHHQPGALGWIISEYVCVQNGEVVASVKQYGPGENWSVSSNGAGFGEFVSKQQAIERAEKVAMPCPRQF